MIGLKSALWFLRSRFQFNVDLVLGWVCRSFSFKGEDQWPTEVDLGDRIRGVSLVVTKEVVGLNDSVVFGDSLHFDGEAEIKNEGDDEKWQCLAHVFLCQIIIVYLYIFHHYQIF